MKKTQMKNEVERLKQFGFDDKKGFNREAIVDVTNRLERNRCRTGLALKIAEYEQAVAKIVWDAEGNADNYMGIEFDENGIDFTIDGVDGNEIDIPIVLDDVLRECEYRLREAYDDFYGAVNEAYECLYLLWSDEALDKADDKKQKELDAEEAAADTKKDMALAV